MMLEGCIPENGKACFFDMQIALPGNFHRAIFTIRSAGLSV